MHIDFNQSIINSNSQNIPIEKLKEGEIYDR